VFTRRLSLASPSHRKVEPELEPKGSRGFTLIELMFVVAILGVLATVAIGAYTKQVRNAHKAEVLSDLSNLTLRQKTFLSVSGHYASSTDCEGPACMYPSGTDLTAAEGEIGWDVASADYTASGASDGTYFRGGPAVHGFDALRFVAQNGRSYCGYATISGHGTNAPDEDEADEPPNFELANDVFPSDDAAAAYYAHDWFYSYALCDFDYDGTFWAFTTAHYTTDINTTSSSDGTYLENE
jgi:type IV pilus assembly protein PilE